jgi:predicted CXXCH cytochrome family protein
MRYGWIVFLLIFIGVVITAYSLSKAPHQFKESECLICHVDVEKSPASLKPMLSSTCDGCHTDTRQKLLHPVDIQPETSVPADMPLEQGRLACITCHFVHSFSIKVQKFTYYLLRRPGKGAPFCSACHRIDVNGHIFFENLHRGSYQVTNQDSLLDRYTLQCIECHDDKINQNTGSLGSGKWQHFSSSKLNHSIGVSYVNISAGKPLDFNHVGALPPAIRLYDGKIGCGTCHNPYSREKSMLVMSNSRSRLCQECHMK